MLIITALRPTEHELGGVRRPNTSHDALEGISIDRTTYDQLSNESLPKMQYEIRLIRDDG
jgi:hypothetical protein